VYAEVDTEDLTEDFVPLTDAPCGGELRELRLRRQDITGVRELLRTET
jgi:hypothetical protein